MQNGLMRGRAEYAFLKPNVSVAQSYEWISQSETDDATSDLR